MSDELPIVRRSAWAGMSADERERVRAEGRALGFDLDTGETATWVFHPSFYDPESHDHVRGAQVAELYLQDPQQGHRRLRGRAVFHSAWLEPSGRWAVRYDAPAYPASATDPDEDDPDDRHPWRSVTWEANQGPS